MKTPARLLLPLLCLASAATAQTVPTAAEVTTDVTKPSPAPADQQAPVMLDPFQVSTSGDIGYLAQSSVSGSRLNTNLADLAAPVSEFTKEFISDVGLHTVDDLTMYMVNTRMNTPEGNNLYFDADSQGFLIRGLPASTYSINFFPTTLRIDLFDVERVDQSRGPNSILFGLGSPGGLVNVSTNRGDLGRTFGSVEEDVGSYNGTRTTLDYNQVLLPNELALRFDAVRDDHDTWRAREYDDSERWYGALSWQVDPNTRMDAEFEHGIVDKSILQQEAVLDGLTPWINDGRHLSNTANAAEGIVSISTTNLNAINTATGVLTDWKGTTASAEDTVAGTDNYLSDFSLVPKDVGLTAGPMSYQNTNYTQGSVYVTHDFTKDLSLEVAAYGQKAYHTALAPRGDVLQVDTNLTLPNGQSNPNAGSPFIDYDPVTTDEFDKRESFRTTASYHLDLGPWLGQHYFAALYEKDWTRMRSDQLIPINWTSGESATLVSAANTLYFRSYFSLAGPKQQMGVGNWLPYLVHPPGSNDTWQDFATTYITNPTTGYKMGVKWVEDSVPADNWFTQDSGMAVMQNHWLKDHLITVLGYRQDREDAWYSDTTAANVEQPVYPGYTTGEYSVVHDAAPIENNAYNLTYSGLLRTWDWLSFFYDHSRNSSLPDPNALVVTPDGGSHPPEPHGVSYDYGFKINLGQRLSFSASYYNTTATNQVANSNATIETVFGNLWTSLNADGIAGPGGVNATTVAQKFNRYTFDDQADGYEFELIANPTPNWRILSNFSINTVKESNIGSLSIDYFNKYSPYWLQYSSLPYTTTAGETIGQAVASAALNIQNLYTLTDGQEGRGQMKYQANLVPVYQFTTGWIRGFWIGAGVTYRSAPVVDYEVAATAPYAIQVYYGRANTVLNAMTGYKSHFKWLHNLPYRVQLNVSNVLDNMQMLPNRELQGQIISYSLQPPTEFLLSAELDF